MGKTRTKKKKLISNPTGMPSVKQMEEENEFELCEDDQIESIEFVIDKLEDRRDEERECGANVIARLSCNSQFLTNLIKRKVLRVAAPLLLDDSFPVRHAIAGGLRNVAVCGDYTVSDAMIEQDVMTSLVELLLQYKKNWKPRIEPNKLDSRAEIFREACNLLWTLCSNSDEAVKIFTKNALIDVLLPCLDVEVFGCDIALAVAHCLVTVTENNQFLVEKVRHSSNEMRLNALMSLPPTTSQRLVLKNLAAGLKLNIFSGKLFDCMDDVVTPILEVVLTTLSESLGPPLQILSKLAVNIKKKNIDRNCDEDDFKNKPKDAFDESANALSDLLEAKRLSLEILGNIFDDTLESEDVWEELSENSEESVDDDGEMDVEESATPLELGLGIPTDIRQIIINGGFVMKITEQIAVPADDALIILKEIPIAKDCLKRLNSVICTALLCMSNVIQKLTIDDFGGPQQLVNTWTNLGSLLAKSDPMDDVLVEAITRCMSAVTRKLCECSGETVKKSLSLHLGEITDSDLEVLMKICHDSEAPAIKVHTIKILTTCGCLLVKTPSPSSASLVQTIVSFLLDICIKSPELWVMAEALDGLFDVFVDDFEYAPKIIEHLSMVEKLQSIRKVLNMKIKQQRQELQGEYVAVIKTAKENLPQFIKYIKEQKLCT